MNIVKKFKIFILGIFIIWCGLWFLAVPAFLSSNFLAEKLGNVIEAQSGFKLSLKSQRVKMGILPTISFHSDEISLVKGKQILRLKNVASKSTLLALLLGKISISKFQAEDIVLVLDEDFSERVLSPEFIRFLKHLDIKNVEVGNLSLDLKNQVYLGDLKVVGQKASIDKFDLNKQIKLISDLNFNDGASRLAINADMKFPLNTKNFRNGKLDLNVENFDLSIFAKTVQKLHPEIEELKGVINLTASKNDFLQFKAQSDGFSVKFAGNDLPIYHTAPLKISSVMNVEGEDLQIKALKIKSDLINATVLGDINWKDKRNPFLNLSFLIDNTNAQELIRLTPPERDLMPELNLYALKKNYFDGDVMAHLDIVGKAPEPDVNGNILIKNAYLIKPIKNAEKATIKLKFQKDKMDLETNVPTSLTERVWANGTFDIYGEKRCTLKVQSTQNVDLATAQVDVNPLQEIIKIDFGPVPIMKILGLGNIDIDVWGNKQDPHINGAFNFKNATVNFIDMPNLIINSANGKLSFTDTDTYFKTDSAILNGKPINVEGSCTLKGVFNFFATSNAQNLANLVADIKGNTLLADLNNYFEQIEAIKGFGDINLNILGNVKNIHEMVINKNVFSKGTITLNAVTLKVKSLPQAISNIFGKIKLDNDLLTLDSYALLNKSKLLINGKIENNDANINVQAKAFRLIDGISILPLDLQKILLMSIKSEDFIDMLPTLSTDFSAKYHGKFDNIQPEKINLMGTIISSKSGFKKSSFELSNSTFKLNPIKINTNDIKLDANALVSNIFSNKRSISGNFHLKDFDINLLNLDVIKSIPEIDIVTRDIDSMAGKINLNSTVRNNEISANCNLQEIKVKSGEQDYEILSGKFDLANRVLHTENLNANLYSMPILLSGKVSLANLNNPTYNLQIKAKPTQDFLDTCFNKNALYPVKVKGDLMLKAYIDGNLKTSHIKSDLSLDKDASVYYMGATLGDKLNAVRLTSDLLLNENNFRINNFNYDKVILTLDKHENYLPLLNISGNIKKLKDNAVAFDNLKIKSKMPVDAKIFNVIFGKPFMKEGSFTSDLVLNGTSILPKIIGKMNITDINIPFVETNINNLNFDFTPSVIKVSSIGDLLTNKVNFKANVKNNLTLPLIVEDMTLHLDQLDMNKINEKVREIEEANFKIHATNSVIQPMDYTNFIVKKSRLTADKILVNNIEANNFKSILEIGQNKILNFRDFSFDMAEGEVRGTITHNYSNNNVKLDLELDKANSSQLAEALFNVKGQLYGLANGKMSLTCNALNDKTCLSSLTGTGNFAIQNGKMPKLGSLEYLLKAGNLISNGITGISVNGLLDLLSPVKGGEFKTISGDFVMNKGIAEKINIYSSGKDLNLFIKGKYNLSTSIADFQIFGSLSKDITSVVNKVKNLSLNTLIKTIPGVKKESNNEFAYDLSQIPNSNDLNSIYKFFRVIIQGDINGDKFVKSFEWVD